MGAGGGWCRSRFWPQGPVCSSQALYAAQPLGQPPTPAPPHAALQETLEGADAGVFRGLLDLARSSHVPPGAASAAAAGPEFAAGCQRLPTGLVLAGGVNSADHCRTFPHLAAFLRQHGCYVALLQPASLGRAAGDATGEVLRQWSGLGASKAEHVDALAAWYADETGADLAAAPEPQQPEPQADEEAAGGGAAGRSRAGRELRARPAAAAVAGPSDAQLANRQRPLVVVVEGTECVDVQALRDLIQLSSEVRSSRADGGVTVGSGQRQALAADVPPPAESHTQSCPERPAAVRAPGAAPQARHCVPLTLVLGLTTTAGALGGLLPSQVIDRCLELHNFRLVRCARWARCGAGLLLAARAVLPAAQLLPRLAAPGMHALAPTPCPALLSSWHCHGRPPPWSGWTR